LICHQRKIKDEKRGKGWSPSDNRLDRAVVMEIPFRMARSFILQYEYLGTMPSGFRTAYGLFWDHTLGCCCVFGSPNPMQIAKSMFGGKHMDSIMQIHRGASTWWAHEHSASFLIGESLRRLKAKGWKAVVAFADPQAGEIGTVYQATNWLCCGLTTKRPDYLDSGGRRQVGVFRVTQDMTRTVRPRKWRYVYILDKRVRKDMRWIPVPYPKRNEPLPEEMPKEMEGA